MTIVIVPVDTLSTLESTVFNGVENFDIIENNGISYMLFMFEKEMTKDQISQFGQFSIKKAVAKGVK
jgi:hypothetical protein